jgi:Dyp-type peroxidase family
VSAPLLDLADVQGVVTFGYRDLPVARLVLLRAADGRQARAWLASIAGQVTSASANPIGAAVNVALTASGLRKLGLPLATLAAFSAEFGAGMAEDHRARMLGDVAGSAPGLWTWGGPNTPEVDVLLLLFASDAAALSALAARQADACRERALAEVWSQDTVDLGRKEHFGFHDGISQPLIEGLPKTGRPDDTVKAGEFLLGYPNEYGLYTDQALLDAARNLAHNGTYLVVRQLAQDVAGFWAFCDQATRHADGCPDEAARAQLAAKMVGRWPGGAPLTLAPAADDPALADANDFRYMSDDAVGLRCPVGAHVRRANPRDSLDPRPGTDASVAVGKRHRILRRGRSYGSPDGPDEQGLMFMCVCANISRQFEFIQSSWVNNPKFAGMYDDADPLLGDHQKFGATFAVPELPVRRRFRGLPRFVTVRGGAYFFLPGLRGLHHLGSLGET